MVATPIFGPFDVARSPNFADNQLINLRPEIGDIKDAKNVGALYGTPGLDLLCTVGSGPVNGLRALGNTLFAVSGTSVYTIPSTAWSGTLVGSISGTTGRVSMIDNGSQVAIFTDTNGYIAPAGYQLTGATVNSGGANYVIGDTIVLTQSGGVQVGAAIVTVATLSGSAVATFTVSQGGSFTTQPTTFSQHSTSGAGSGLTLTSTTFSGSTGLATIALPYVTTPGQTISATFQDGFGIINQPGTQAIWQSTVTDISVWPPLNFADAEGASDNVAAVLSLHRNLMVVKDRTVEVWTDAGTTGFAFQALGSVLIEQGIVSWPSLSRCGEAMLWLSRNGQGNGIVLQAEGFSAQRVSTHAVEYMLAQAITLTDAFAYSYQQEGHQLYVLTLPRANLTLVYDRTDSAKAGFPIWYQWMNFSNGVFNRHWGNAFAFFNDTPVLGDYRNGNLYRINLNTLTDNGSQRKWVRSWRALSEPSMQPRRFPSLQIDLQTGVNIPDGTDPEVMLEWSDDGGNNWFEQRIQLAGAPGQTAFRLRFNRLGSTRRNSGLDRIFRLSSADQFPVCVVRAELDV